LLMVIDITDVNGHKEFVLRTDSFGGLSSWKTQTTSTSRIWKSRRRTRKTSISRWSP